ncbi:MAG TPA: BrnT family toxin [Longimicrobium sp.]|jgi:uncharacterized DUF497 family protein
MKPPPKGYQWDPAMDARCHEQYAFGFHDVVQVFNDPETDYLVYGPVVRDEEERFVAIGRMEWGTVVAVVYTIRDGEKRLIWVRPARANERAEFYEHNGLDTP